MKCKNLKYKTDEFPVWGCDFKFKFSNITIYRFDVLYEENTYENKGEPKVYCYIKDTPFLQYILDYVPPPDRPVNPEPSKPNKPNKPNSPKSTEFNWTWIIVIGSILSIVGILVTLVMFTEIGRNTFNSFKS